MNVKWTKHPEYKRWWVAEHGKNDDATIYQLRNNNDTGWASNTWRGTVWVNGNRYCVKGRTKWEIQNAVAWRWGCAVKGR